MTRFKPDNLLHLIHDDLLPLIATTGEQGLIGHFQIFFDDHWLPKLGNHLFSQFSSNLFFRNHFAFENSVICFQNAYLGLSTSTVWYQYGFTKPQSFVERTKEEYSYIQTQIRLLRERFISSYRLQNECSTRHTLLISREKNRKMLNLEQFSNYLKKKFNQIPLKVITIDNGYLEDMDQFRQLLQNVFCAQTLISMHGSEQILAIFIKPDQNVLIRIIELFPYGVEANYSTIYRTLAQSILGYKYHCWTNPLRKNAHFPDDHYPSQHGGLAHLDAEKIQSIKQTIDQPMKEFLCCDDPEWLYRIYQDTVIDIDMFDQFLSEQQQRDTNSSTINEGMAYNFQLSEVQNLRCSFYRKNNNETKMKVIWTPPWNLPFASEMITKYFYEVAIQSFDTDQAVIYETNRLSIELEANVNDQCYYVWAKVKFYDTIQQSIKYRTTISSSFNRQPLFCCLQPTIDRIIH